MKKTQKLFRSMFFAMMLVMLFSALAFAGDGSGGNSDQALTLEVCTPADKTEDLALDAVIKMDFSKNVVHLSVKENNAQCFNMTDSKGNAVAFVVEMGDDQVDREIRNTINVRPAEQWPAGETLTLTISKDLCSKSGSSMASPVTLTFKTVASEAEYSDVADENLEAVTAMVEKGYLKANANNTIGAAAKVKRGEFVMLVGRCRDINASKYTASSYDDVSSSAAAMPYIEWATGKGIIMGYGDGKFGADDALTREQAACILYRYANIFDAANKASSVSIGSYADADKVCNWAKDAMKWAVAVGVLAADDANCLNPDGTVTREEMAKMVYDIVGIR
ncbi:MAG: S-layer homology domain-containing protein [Firmicutes bacterium]|nr:S-layer homology domain-containing protein [Bacillota bacterium]